MNIKDLEKCFEHAKEGYYTYVAVVVTVPSCENCEIIINPRSNFDSKLEYYKKAYNDDLTLKSFNQIKITNFFYSDDVTDIENELI